MPRFGKPHNAKNIINNRFGRLIAVRRIENSGSHAQYLCLCDCGVEIKVTATSLKIGNTQSCGCLRKEVTARRSKTHGRSTSRLYTNWYAMIQRCENPHHKNFADYGGRGIKVCDRWHSFENFLSDMGEPPTSKHTIDRTDNNLGYFHANCRWATRKEQNNNTRASHFVEFQGQRKTLAQWAETIGISRKKLHDRIMKLKWPVEKAFGTIWESDEALLKGLERFKNERTR